MSARLKAVAGILSALAVVITTLAVLLSGGGPAPVPTVTVPSVNGPAVTVPVPVLDHVENTEAGHHEDLRSEKMVTPQDRKANEKKANPLTPSVEGPPPLASPVQRGCLTRQIPVNLSARNGTKPLLIVLHYTVSRNVVGWGDVNAIFAWFSRGSTQASSNYVYDNEGHCIYMVPESQKAWAQAGFNSYTACSFEVVNTGFESTYIGLPGGRGERALATGVHDCAARWHIPLHRASTGGCRVNVPGVADHRQLGACGGGHGDIGKFSVGNIITAAQRIGQPVVLKPPAKVVSACRGVVRYRIAAAGGQKHGPGATALYRERLLYLKVKHYACGRHGTKMVLKHA